MFGNGSFRRVIEIGIVDDEEYEKNECFYVELGEPMWVKKMSGKLIFHTSTFTQQSFLK